MLPLRDSNPTTRRPIVTLALIAANVAVFVLWQPTFKSQSEQLEFSFCHAEIAYEIGHQTNLAGGGAEARDALDETFGPSAGEAVQQALRRACPAKSWWLPLLVSMFMHGGWLHLGSNMLFLWIFGNNVEDKIGHIPYLLFYLAGGIVASLAQFALDPNSAVPTLGASGAVAAVLGAYLVMFPRRRVLTAVFLIFITMIELPAVVVLGIWFALQFFSGASTVGENISGGVAYWAHVGGFVAGVLVALAFFPKERRPKPRLPYEVD
ncbi:MAG: rhomboid family intramembrane serine protease [Actinomycetota bacterium]